ncbi:GNAT family N-acetyltransferase [Alkalibacterium pelagium]|uniref:UDP-4-amino-4,6-dideoxy-N-acetyl-beta-L-altrosamine N-acetyltransferase n=1 Tax=Alkalibacterium pelagium TaxID=426702 RepID=A0A1H7HSF8_9LACT|nr:GNAT family protein [Alkalibacterium pelagium]GEN50357.1 N-acetyltransferase [Alkalibacterium pelagium]SEK53221.1 UDP-4-amino-4,6-dideoxy-N-acetyl-beta-L-altrosamine N-acetyltransferase [Alkalibacterium pelagium]
MYRLRELEREDIPAINSWRSDKDLIESLGAPFRYINKEVDYNWFDNYLTNRGNNIRCSILNEADQLIGLVSLTNIDRLNQSAVFHIMIGKSSKRSKGIGSYATNEILNHAFCDMNLNRVELSVLASNERAIALYEKVGFKKEGVERQAVFKNGRFADMVSMAILKDEFSPDADL